MSVCLNLRREGKIHLRQVRGEEEEAARNPPCTGGEQAAQLSYAETINGDRAIEQHARSASRAW